MYGPSLTRDQVRELDRIAIQQIAIPGIVLMENAGRACAIEAMNILPEVGTRVAVFCGKGNNGGDGFVIARHLINARYEVEVWLSAERKEVLSGGGDAATNLEVILNMGVPVRELGEENAPPVSDICVRAGLIVDALLGTGISGDVREPARSIIERINESGRPVLAVDIPSGLDCDKGTPMGVAVRALRTVTFVMSKKGFEADGAADYTGGVVVAEISIPRTLIERKLAEWGALPGA